MSEIDRKRWTAVVALERLGWVFCDGHWQGPQRSERACETAADAMHGVLMDRAEELLGCIEGSDEEKELMATGEALERYEAVRWPYGKIAGGKG